MAINFDGQNAPSVGEVVRGKLFELGALRTKMVIDDIEHYGEADPMSAIDKTAKIVRRPI